MDELTQAIYDLYQSNKKNMQFGKVFNVLNNIPNSKLTKAKNTYAAISHDEIVIVLHDSTLFGSGKEGFVLTSKALYHRYAYSRDNVTMGTIHISDIKSVKADTGLTDHIDLRIEYDDTYESLSLVGIKPERRGLVVDFISQCVELIKEKG